MLPPWPESTREIAPPQGAAHVFAVWLRPGPQRLAELRGLLSADEVAKADRFAFPELKVRSAAARGQLREILGAALGVPKAELKFQYGENGKPRLAEAGPLHFNVSHSGDLALVSLSDREHGVDVELHKDRSYDDVARRFFAAAEVEQLFSLPDAAREAAFFDTWTAKEAFVKATGVGITVPLGDFEARWQRPTPAERRSRGSAAWFGNTSGARRQGGVGLGAEGHIEVLRGPAQGRPFWLQALQMADGASGAIVAEGARVPVSVSLWPPAP